MLPAPRLSGSALRALAISVRAGPVRKLVARQVRRDLGIESALALGEELRGPLAMSFRPVRARLSHDRASLELGAPRSASWPRTGAALAHAYIEKRTTPSEIVERALDAARSLAAESPSFGPIHVYDDSRARSAAAESTERYARGRPLGPLDGVPVAIKEELDVAGLATRLGTGWLPKTPATSDATSVARLRAAGAVVLGHTPMTEYGMNPLGVSPHRVLPRNPHDPTRLAGGSSTGSGVAVATGVCPLALGCDGGGSIRVPACFSGVFGLKPTFGRISRTGQRTGGSMSHTGPLAASTHDIAVAVEICDGEDPEDDLTHGTPALEPAALVRALGRGVRGLRVGVDDAEWGDASPEVARAGRDALRALEGEGAVLVPVTISMARAASAIGYLSIGLEERAALADVRRNHLDEIGPELQILLALMSEIDATGYLEAQHLRAGVRREMAKLLANVDVLALPMTAATAPAATDEELRTGLIDPAVLNAVSRFVYIGNLTGLPAATAPVGVDRDGLPIGLQVIGDAWDEACVLQVLAHLERLDVARPVRPRAASRDLF